MNHHAPAYSQPATLGSAPGKAHSGLANISARGLHRQANPVLLAVCSLLCCSAAFGAKSWSINPGFTLSEVYLDKIAPGFEGGDESDYITQINPVLQAELNGRRIEATLNYRMQNIFYAENSNQDRTYHQFLALTSTEILPEHFFVDASTSRTQRSIFSGGDNRRGNIILTNNRTNELTASIRPSWYQPIGSHAEALLDFEHGIVAYDDNGVVTANSNLESAPVALFESSLDSASLAIASVAGEQRLSWKINTRAQHIDYDDNAIDDVKLRNTGLLLGYQIIPGFSPLALIGYEDNDFGGRFTTTAPKGTSWALGFRWRPNARTELEALAGGRYFGNTYRVNWRQGGRYLSSELTYSEVINGNVSSALENASLIDSRSGYNSSSLGLTNDVYLSKTLRASASFEKSRSLITITSFQEKLEFEISARDETQSGITGTWSWAFAPRTTFTLTMDRDKTATSFGSDQTSTGSDVKLARQLGKQTTASIKYSYNRADSDDSQNAYTENDITVWLTHFFGTPARETSAPPSRRSRKQLRGY